MGIENNAEWEYVQNNDFALNWESRPATIKNKRKWREMDEAQNGNAQCELL